MGPRIVARRQRWALFGLAAAVGCAAWTLAPSRAPRAGAAEPVVQAAPGAAELHASLGPGASRRYRLQLAAGRYARLEVEQSGVDAVLRVLDPAGAVLVEADGWFGGWGPERAAFVTELPGAYVLEVAPANEKAGTGRIAVRLVESGEATPRNRRRAAGERALAEGRLLFLVGRQPEYERALDHFGVALGHFRAVADVAGQADALFAIGTSELAIGRRPESLAALDQAVPLARSISDRRREAEALGMRAAALKELGERQRALDDLARALELWRAVEGSAREIARTLNILSSVYSELGDRRNTLSYASLALRHARGLDDYALCQALQVYGGAALWVGEPERALAPLRQALSLSRQVAGGQQPLEARVLANLGAALRLLERDEEARETLRQALALFRSAGDRPWEAIALLQLAGTYRAPHERALQREFAEASRRVASEVGYFNGEAPSLAMLGRLALEEGDFAEARRLTEESLRIRERQWRLAPSPSLQAAFLGSQLDGYELQVELLVRAAQAGAEPRGAALALEASEGTRARDLQRRLLQAREEIHGGVPAELLARRRSLGRDLLSRAASQSGPGSLAATREAEAVAAELRAVERSIAQASPRYAALMLPEPITVEELQRELLDGDTVLLEYALGRRRSYVWAVDRSSLRVFELPPRQEVEAAARAVSDAVTARGAAVRFETVGERRARIQAADAAFRVAARALSRMALEPVASALGGRRLAMVTDGALQYVPWSALPVPGGGGATLASRHEIVHLPSAAVLREIRRGVRGRAAAPRALAVLADPVVDASDPRLGSRSGAPAAPARAGLAQLGLLQRGPGVGSPTWPDLPHAREEARAILALVPPRDRLGAFGFAASRELVEGGQLAGYRMLHFATHAEVDSEEAELSGIVLSMLDERGRRRDGFLSLFDLYQLRLPADLVVLSGCRTALGQELRGEGLVGLTRGFMFAGSPRVVVSLWDVQDQPTAELMKRFYTAMLRRGRPPAAALREAQLAMAQSPRWSEPYYWAGFVLQGDWR